MSKNNLLKLAVEVLKELPAGAEYVSRRTPSDAQVHDNPSGRGQGHWFPEKYAEDKKRHADKQKPSGFSRDKAESKAKGEKPKADSPKQKEPSAYPSGSPQEFRDFDDYVKSFYGKTGLYNLGVSDKDIDNAINEYIEETRTGFTWGGGDSVDRERVRDILIRNYKNKK
tara:strand:- start:1302 stop:1808 length:507 start_codon:yes stop_codon:yes gene_type:complete